MANIVMADAKGGGLQATIVTIPANVTNGEELKNSVEAIQDLVPGSLLIITKPRALWEPAQFIFGFIGVNGSLSAGYRYGSNSIEPRNLTSTYDFKASAGDKYYMVSIPVN